MNANKREHSYGDLREIVIDVMLDAGEQGMNSFDGLLEKTALKLDKQDEAAAARRHVSYGPASRLHPNDSELVLEIVWDLCRQGILTFGPNPSNPAWPCLRRSRFGEFALRRGPHRFPDNSGFMKTLRLEPADLSPDAVIYLREAAAAFYMDRLLSTCVVLGVAAEGEFLRLIAIAKASQTHGRCFSRIGDELAIGAKISQFKEAIKSLEPVLSTSATDELDHNLEAIQLVIRMARRESGQPSGALPPSRDQVYLYLQLFILFAKQAMRLRQELNEPAYPRLVPLH